MSDLCPPLIPTGIERIGEREGEKWRHTKYHRLVPAVMKKNSPLPISFRPNSVALSRFSPFSDRLSITGGLTTLKCVPSCVRHGRCARFCTVHFVDCVDLSRRPRRACRASCRFNSNDTLDFGGNEVEGARSS